MPTQRLSLILIDDDPFALEMHAAAAAAAFPSAKVEVCNDSLAGLQRCQSEEFDCVMVDYEMPVLNGIEFISRLRVTHPHLPIVLCTGAGDEMLAIKSLQSGVTDYIPKSAIAGPSMRRTIRHAVELAAKGRKIVEQRRELETFAFAMAHDFKQPLRQIITFSDIVAADVRRNELADVHQHLAYMSAAARRLSELVDVMSRYTLVGEAPELGAISIGAIAREVATSIEPYVRDRHGRLEIHGDGTALGNAALMRQIIQNLVVNGLKYNESAAPAVRITTEVEGTTCRVSVRDNGIGVLAEFTERIFQPLVRLHPSSQYPGSGVGLALARKAATAQNGSIVCRSKPGQGSEFVVQLSAAPSG